MVWQKLLLLILICVVVAECNSPSVLVEPESVTFPLCGNWTTTLECHWKNDASFYRWFANGEDIIMLLVSCEQSNRFSTVMCEMGNCSQLILDTACDSKWLENGTNISCRGYKTFGEGQALNVCISDNVLITWQGLEPLMLDVDCNGAELQIGWIQPSIPDLIVEIYTVQIYSTNESLLAENYTTGTNFSIQSDCDYGKVCIQANTSAGMGCKNCKSKDASTPTPSDASTPTPSGTLPSAATSVSSSTATSVTSSTLVTPTVSSLALAPSTVGWIQIAATFFVNFIIM